MRHNKSRQPDAEHIASGLDKARRTGTRHRAPLPIFTIEELATLHWYCLHYRDLVRSGGTPTPEQDARFLAFSAITYATGVAHVEP